MPAHTHLIFDMDGTLVDSSAVLCNTINYVRGHLGLAPMEEAAILRGINDTSIHAPSYFYGVQEYAREHLIWFQEYYRAHHRTQTRLYPGIEALLSRLKEAGLTLTVATNAYRSLAQQLLFVHEIERYFDLLVCGDEVEHPKPDPQMLMLIMEYYALPKTRFLLIGDAPKDLEAARRAGIDAVAVDWGFGGVEEGETIGSIASLERILLQ